MSSQQEAEIVNLRLYHCDDPTVTKNISADLGILYFNIIDKQDATTTPKFISFRLSCLINDSAYDVALGMIRSGKRLHPIKGKHEHLANQLSDLILSCFRFHPPSDHDHDISRLVFIVDVSATTSSTPDGTDKIEGRVIDTEPSSNHDHENLESNYAEDTQEKGKNISHSRLSLEMCIDNFYEKLCKIGKTLGSAKWGETPQVEIEASVSRYASELRKLDNIATEIAKATCSFIAQTSAGDSYDAELLDLVGDFGQYAKLISCCRKQWKDFYVGDDINMRPIKEIYEEAMDILFQSVANAENNLKRGLMFRPIIPRTSEFKKILCLLQKRFAHDYSEVEEPHMKGIELQLVHNLTEHVSQKNNNLTEHKFLLRKVRPKLEIIYGKKNMTSCGQIDERNLEACCVCLSGLPREGEISVKMLCCKHMFHRDCIFKWLSRRFSCPYCRADSRNDVYLESSKGRYEAIENEDQSHS